jgi:hypothetical protein
MAGAALHEPGDFTMEDLAVIDLAASALAKKSGGEDNAILGNPLVLLTARPCRASCRRGRTPRARR